ncbi:MAG TPA: hypothetical protein DEB39_06590, partial [Planctomycetaceae bacterium]|nr:hypothetical protein [Planctomycetaceae bacterium]
EFATEEREKLVEFFSPLTIFPAVFPVRRFFGGDGDKSEEIGYNFMQPSGTEFRSSGTAKGAGSLT